MPTSYGKKHSDWAYPALSGGVVGGFTPVLMRQISPVFDQWFGPSDSLMRLLSEAGAAGLILGVFIVTIARLIFGKNVGSRS